MADCALPAPGNGDAAVADGSVDGQLSGGMRQLTLSEVVAGGGPKPNAFVGDGSTAQPSQQQQQAPPPSSADDEAAAAAGDAQQQQEQQPQQQQGRSQQARSQRLCMYWVQSRSCRYGDQCRYVHDDGKAPHLSSPGGTRKAPPGGSGNSGGGGGGGNRLARKQGLAKFKTRMCRHFEAGEVCPFGSQCTFAHGMEEMVPDRTNPHQPQGPHQLQFQHQAPHAQHHQHQQQPHAYFGFQQSLGGHPGGPLMGMPLLGGPPAGMAVDAFARRQQAAKTRMCRYYAAQETCPFGASCRFAHGNEELRPSSSQANGNNNPNAPQQPDRRVPQQHIMPGLLVHPAAIAAMDARGGGSPLSPTDRQAQQQSQPQVWYAPSAAGGAAGAQQMQYAYINPMLMDPAALMQYDPMQMMQMVAAQGGVPPQQFVYGAQPPYLPAGAAFPQQQQQQQPASPPLQQQQQQPQQQQQQPQQPQQPMP